jgi:hypothetical protein
MIANRDFLERLTSVAEADQLGVSMERHPATHRQVIRRTAVATHRLEAECVPHKQPAVAIEKLREHFALAAGFWEAGAITQIAGAQQQPLVGGEPADYTKVASRCHKSSG